MRMNNDSSRRIHMTRSIGPRASVAIAALVVVAATASAVGAQLRGDRSAAPSDQITPSSLHRALGHSAGRATPEVWSASTADGRKCAFFPTSTAGPSSAADALHAAGFCPVASSDESQSATPFYTTLTSWVEGNDGGYVPVLRGSLRGGGVATIRAEGPNRSISGESSDGYFSFDFPTVPESGAFPSGGPYYLVGLDAAGAEVFRLNVSD